MSFIKSPETTAPAVMLWMRRPISSAVALSTVTSVCAFGSFTEITLASRTVSGATRATPLSTHLLHARVSASKPSVVDCPSHDLAHHALGRLTTIYNKTIAHISHIILCNLAFRLAAALHYPVKQLSAREWQRCWCIPEPGALKQLAYDYRAERFPLTAALRLSPECDLYFVHTDAALPKDKKVPKGGEMPLLDNDG